MKPLPVSDFDGVAGALSANGLLDADINKADLGSCIADLTDFVGW
jgi:hypothetical protein